MRTSSPLLVSPALTIALTLATAVILLTANFTIINAQQQGQQVISQTGEIGNGTEQQQQQQQHFKAQMIASAYRFHLAG